MLSNCSEMLILGTYWKTWYSMVSEPICTIDHEMDQSLWQTPESIDIFYCAFWEVTRLCQQVGCVRSKPQFRTVQQNPKSSPWTLDWDKTGFPLSIYGIWLIQSLGTRLRTMTERWNPFFAVIRIMCKCNLEECSMFWIMLTVFPQTSNFRIKKLCGMCSKTTRQWSIWL